MSQIYEDVDSAFAKTCSDITVYSSSKGFFKNVIEEVLSVVEEGDWMQSFENTDVSGKIKAVMENKEIMRVLEEVLSRIQPLFRSKDSRVSNERRLAAQAALKDGDLVKALALASQAVLRATMTGQDEVVDGGVSLALALWLRSEVLLQAGRPRAALEDLKLALKERLPAKMRAQYYWRMGHCYKGAGEPTRAKVSYELAGRLLMKDENAKLQLNKDIESLDFTVQLKNPPDKAGATPTGGTKQNMPSLSKLVKITEDERKGRFAVANSHIKTGDVLLVDNPYAACLLPDHYGTHCLHCFKRLEDREDESPIGCPKCSGVAFCSIQCRDTAVSSYHGHECQFQDLFIGSGMSILSHIALRMVTQAGLKTSLDIHSKYLSNEIKTVEGSALNDIEGVGNKKSKMRSRKERLNRSKKGLKSLMEKATDNDNVEEKTKDKMNFEESLELKAGQIYSLCTHATHRKGHDYLKRIIMGKFLMECLTKGGFFKDCGKENIYKAEISIWELIVCNLQLLQFNAHEIYETIRGQKQFSGSKTLYVAVGIYPTGALFNHECYPAVARYFEGRKIVLRTTRPLEPGDVVSENYGPHFLVRSLKERQRSLACRYWFRCECVSCKEDWPLLKQMGSDIYLRCPNISCHNKFRANIDSLPNRCIKCSINIDKNLMRINLETVLRCIAQYQRGAKLMEEESPLEAIKEMSEAIDMFHEVAMGPHRETHLAQESLRPCYAAAGNVHVVTKENNCEEMRY